MKKEVQKELETFEEKYKLYKEGKGSAPIVHKSMSIRVNDSDKRVCLSAEEMDRDGETVMMSGMILSDDVREKGLPLIDSHNSHSSVVENGLGALRNLRIETINGKKCLMCEPDFAPTPKGEIAKILYMGVDGGKPYFTNVSMGFLVYDYDNKTKQILEWEPFEGSLVTIGANFSARFMDKAAKTDSSVDEETMAKNLARFQQIHEPFKEFTKLFLSDSFLQKLGYEKDGDLLVDINAIYDIIDRKFDANVEAPPAQEAPEEQPQPEASPEAVATAILDAFIQKLG